MSTVVEATAQDSSPEVAEDWDNDDKAADEARTKQLEERLRQVQIIQKEKEDKEAREKARVAEAKNLINAQPSSNVSNVAPLKMQILRRPKSGDQLKEEEMKQREEEARSRMKKLTFEQRQAAYDEARNRILGSDYKPESTVPAPVVHPVSRNRSPEQIRVVRQPVDQVPMFVPGMMPSDDPSRHQQMNYPQHFVGPPPIPPNQPYVPYFDSSRPPPLMNFPPYSHVPIAQYGPTGQYYAPMPTAIPQPQAMQHPYGRPPISIYPPGTLGATMQFNIDSGQSQAQRKNRKGKKGKTSLNNDQSL